MVTSTCNYHCKQLNIGKVQVFIAGQAYSINNVFVIGISHNLNSISMASILRQRYFSRKYVSPIRNMIHIYLFSVHSIFVQMIGSFLGTDNSNDCLLIYIFWDTFYYYVFLVYCGIFQMFGTIVPNFCYLVFLVFF